MTRAHVTIQATDREAWTRLMKLERQLRDGQTFVKVGVIGNRKSGYEPVGSDLDMVGLATVHEFGAPSRGIPERSWIRSTFEQQRPKFDGLVKQYVRQLYEGKMTVERALGLLGVQLAADIKNRVTQGSPIPPPNAPATLEAKMAKSRGALTRNTNKQRKAEHIPRARNEGRASGPLLIRTLVDTGRMVNSVAWVVVVEGKEGKAG